MVDKQVIHSTFNRIEEALDLRFQGENALFISKANSFKLVYSLPSKLKTKPSAQSK